MKSVCFTGHREVKETDTIRYLLDKVLTDLIEKGVTDFYAGGALGWDMLCEKAVLNLREEFPHIRLNLILPCPPEIQIAKWNSSERSEYFRIYTASDSVKILSDTYYDGCMKKRNQALVELSEICVCYCTRFRSGTGQTVRMAEKNNLTIINIADNPEILP